MAGKVKVTRQRANLPGPDAPRVSMADSAADLKSAEVVPPSAFRPWWIRVLLGLRRRRDDTARSRTVRTSARTGVSETAQAIFALYQARGYTRALPRNESFGAELPIRIRLGMRMAKRILRAAWRTNHQRH